MSRGGVRCNAMRRRLLVVVTALLIALALFVYVGAPYARATSLIVRAADLGGRAEAFANREARTGRHRASPADHDSLRRCAGAVLRARGDVTPDRAARARHSLDGHRGAATDGARRRPRGAGVKVMAMALPDLQAYRITPRATDVIEDAVTWMAQRPDLAPDGRVGIVGISFAGGLSICRREPSVDPRQGRVRPVVRRAWRSAARHALPGHRRGAAGAGTRDASAARLRRRGDPVWACRSRRRAARSGRRAARRDRDISAGVAVDAREHGPGERHVRQGARDGDDAAGAVAHVS